MGAAGYSPATGVGGAVGPGGSGGSPERPMTSAGFRDEVATVAEQGYEAPLHPRGMQFELQLLNTWGDRHYAGLTAMEIYDEDGAIITPLTHDMVWEADVDSVNVLAEVSVRFHPHSFASRTAFMRASTLSTDPIIFTPQASYSLPLTSDGWLHVRRRGMRRIFSTRWSTRSTSPRWGLSST